jgi:WD40 repeat protein
MSDATQPDLSAQATLPPSAPAVPAEPITETLLTCKPPSSIDAATLAAAASVTTESTPAALDVPGYQILGELGRGGMGVVYRARQIKADRLVALKMILVGGHAGSEDLLRFRTEAESLARLQHPNIVQVHDVSEHESRPYFSMEFCPGGSLEKKLNSTPIAPQEAAALVEKLARAMAAAHDKGVIHRDLKPANVLLAEDGTPKITDFGLAKKLDQQSGQTKSGAIMGTPSYMAPEQAGGKAKELGPVCDVYALGAILYECLTGRPPFKAATALDTVLQVVSEEPVSPSQLNVKTPKDLETICLKCLQKDPGRRYSTSEALADDLLRFRAGAPIAARPVRLPERAWKWVKRRPAVAALSGALVVLLIAATVISMFLAWWAMGERDDAVSARQDANKRAEEAAAARKEAQRRTALTLFVHALSRADDDIPEGMFWAAHALKEATKAENETTVQSIRQQLAIWAQRVHRLRLAFLDEGHFLRGAAFCEGSRRLLTWAGNRRDDVHLWDATTGESLGRLRHDWSVRSVAVSPDGKIILTGHDDNTARLWSAATGMPIGPPFQHKDSVWSVAFSPDGKTVVTGSMDSTARLWNAATGQPIGLPLQHKGAVGAVAFSRDGKIVLTGSVHGTARLWDTATGKPLSPPLEQVEQHWRGTALVLIYDGNSLLSLAEGSGAGEFAFGVAWHWNNPTNPTPARRRKLEENITSYALSPDRKTVLIESWKLVGRRGEYTIRLWDVDTGKSSDLVLPQQGSIERVAFSPDGKTILAASKDDTATLWDLAKGKSVGPPLRFPRPGQLRPLLAVAFSPDGKSMLTLTWGDRTVRLWDVASERSLEKPPQFHTVAFPDGRIWLGGNEIQKASAGKMPAPLLGEPESIALWITVITGTELSADGRGLYVLDANTWKQRRQQLQELGGPPPGY